MAVFRVKTVSGLRPMAAQLPHLATDVWQFGTHRSTLIPNSQPTKIPECTVCVLFNFPYFEGLPLGLRHGVLKAGKAVVPMG